MTTALRGNKAIIFFRASARLARVRAFSRLGESRRDRNEMLWYQRHKHIIPKLKVIDRRNICAV